MIKVLIKEPGKLPEIREIQDSLETYQDIVGGLIEVVRLDITGVTLFCDDEGKIKNKKPNFVLTDMFGKPMDVIFGTVILFRAEGEDCASLTEEQIGYYFKWLIDRDNNSRTFAQRRNI